MTPYSVLQTVLQNGCVKRIKEPFITTALRMVRSLDNYDGIADGGGVWRSDGKYHRASNSTSQDSFCLRASDISMCVRGRQKTTYRLTQIIKEATAVCPFYQCEHGLSSLLLL